MSAFSPRLLNHRILEAALGRGAVADRTKEKMFHVHKGPCTSSWLPRT